MNEEEDKISQKILTIKEDIETKERTIEQLRNFFNNVNDSSEINELERECLISAVERKIRIEFPEKAKKILGDKSEKAKELLEEFFGLLKEEFDWSKNKVGSRVKVGGDMISGRQYVNWYISYKNKNKTQTHLSYNQKTPKDDPFLQVSYGGSGDAKENETKTFRVELKEDALNLYKSFLSKTIIKE
jgi:hypothetical protein